MNVIAEVKRASPSRGKIKDNVEPGEFAKKYEAGGAAAISVLTDRDYFGARPGDLLKVRASSRLPVLRKDFIVDFPRSF
jgi:indole-3-glycerol phosphate synthase